MTVLISNRRPGAGDISVARRTRPGFTISSGTALVPDRSLLDVWVLVGTGRETQVIIGGAPADEATSVANNGLGGLDVVVGGPAFLDSETVSVRARFQGPGGLDETWSFTTSDSSSPVLSHLSHPPGSIAQASPTSASLTISDASSQLVQLSIGVSIGDYDVVVDGSATPPPGWTVALTMSPSGDGALVDVTAIPPGVWAVGEDVRVRVRAQDVNGNGLDTSYSFAVGDVRGPIVTSTTPGDGARGLSTIQALTLVLETTQAVDSSSVSVGINGQSAIAAGIVQAGYTAGSSISPSADTVTVILVSDSGWVDGQMLLVDVTSADASGRQGPRTVIRFHVGTTVAEDVVAHGLTGQVTRVCAFDYSQTPFARPVELGHTGFAADGLWYQSGVADMSREATWHVELGDFPLSGYVILTDSEWGVLEPLDQVPWMKCAAGATYETMAGLGQIRDGVMAQGRPVLFTASDVIVAVDFARDLSVVYDDGGRGQKPQTIVDRQVEGRPVVFDSDYSLADAGPYQLLAADVTGDGSLVLAVPGAGSLTVVTDLSAQLALDLLAEFGKAAAARRVASDPAWSQAAWSRVVIVGDHMALAFDDGVAQAHVDLWQWYKFAADLGREALLDDTSTPPLSAGQVADVALAWPVVAAAVGDVVDIVDVDRVLVDTRTALAMGLGSGSVLALALDAWSTVVYVSGTNGVVASEVRSGDTALVSATTATSLSAVGQVHDDASDYVATTMTVV